MPSQRDDDLRSDPLSHTTPPTSQQARSAALTVAAHARDITDCAELLAMLGIATNSQPESNANYPPPPIT